MNILSKFKLISCEVGPNYQLDDALVAKLSLLNIFGIGQSSAMKWCASWFRSYLNLNAQDKLLFTDNGRTSLYLILKSLNFASQSEVLIQTFSCAVLPNSVWQAGLTPILCDVDQDNYNFDLEKLQSKITSKTKAIVVQYTFGIVPDMQKIVEFCQKNKLVLIEDCAHSLGATTTINGQQVKVGSIGQAAFFSFGRDKIVSTTIGGVGLFNSQNLIDSSLDFSLLNKTFQKNYDHLPHLKTVRVAQALLYAIINPVFVRPLYHFVLGKVILLLSRKLRLFSEIYTPKEKLGTNSLETNSKYSLGLASLLKHQLQKFEKLNSHRRELAQIYAKGLGLDYFENNVYMRFVIDFKKLSSATDYKQNYLKTYKKLRQNRVLPGTWYKSFFQPNIDLAKFNSKLDDFPVAATLCDNRILNLPTNINVSKEQAQRLVELILK
ncbi:MAG: aminotransferase class I/II-fold pyridoxal phosphate-dependent enzyme [bacterium]